ncbi:hypothetical protein DYE49_00980 [Treponema rectale]|uniref:Lipoprotein n=1 Tax=Treponema rectale TaxID=744512 RepID=A0A7M1XJY8_9SPIR|nr:hypothetical protein DYE49_00980 [Treponema rectale]
MKSKLAKLLLLVPLSLSLIGCDDKEEVIVTKDESTIIKDAKSTDPYLKNKDYNSLAYAFIYNLKSGLKSYESNTTGSVKAKVMFFDYNIEFDSCIYKSGNKFYSKDYSTSIFMTIQNEFYMVDKEKILVSRDMKEYNVYTMDDYHQISYSFDQYTIMGYVFNNESIRKAELVSDKEDNISIKYTLDNELATNLVKIDLKENGGLSSYPTFDKIELTLSMKNDFTPLSYSINAVYDASKPFIGSSKVTQVGECKFSKVNEEITIPNETFLAQKLGADPSKLVLQDEEREIKDELLDSVKRLDLAKGVNLTGDVTIDLQGVPMVLNIDGDLSFDTARLTEDELYSTLNFYCNLQGNEMLNSLISLIKSVAKDSLGDYASLLDEFKSLNIVYDGKGNIYLIPNNQNDVTNTVLKIKLTDILDGILQKINLYNLISNSNNDLVTFKKTNIKDDKNFTIELSLNEETITNLKKSINTFLEGEYGALLKVMLGYEDFDSLNISATIKDGLLSGFDASLKYLKTAQEENQQPTVTTLISAHLSLENKEFNYQEKITQAEEIYSTYQSVLDLKSRMEALAENIYVSEGCLKKINEVLTEYEALSQQQKDFISTTVVETLQRAKENLPVVLQFIAQLNKYDLDHLDNQTILELATLYTKGNINRDLLISEIGDETYNKLTSMDDKVDYTTFDNCISKFTSEDETTWGLTTEEIKDIKLLFDIAKIYPGVKTTMMLKLLMAGNTLSIDDLETKINNLANN